MKQILFIILLIWLPVLSCAQVESNAETNWGQTFIPDSTFTGSSLINWHTIDGAEWQARNGMVSGKSSNGGGLLVFNSSYQDVGFHALFKCTGSGKAGILFRMEKTNNGTTAIMLPLKKGNITPYRVFLDEKGGMIKRKKLEYAGGNINHLAPPANEFERGGDNNPQSLPDLKIELPFKRPDYKLHHGEWNQIEIFLNENIIRSFLNDGGEIGGRVGSGSEEYTGLNGYGPIALYVSGQGEVHFKELMVKDLALKVTPKERSSARFKTQRISDMYYSWGSAVADFNKDGNMDIVAGPYIYYGPDYTKRREIYPAIVGSSYKEYPKNIVQHTCDFNNDGWADVLSTTFNNMILYLNPQGENRRWDSYKVLPEVRQGEITELVDIDRDGIPELVYSADKTLRYAKPDTSNPTKPWKQYIISKKGYGIGHGIGVGDINGNGKMDILNAFGWWEQPQILNEHKLWKYHSVAFGRYGRHRTNMNMVGGSEMGVFDVNGNGLNDVVTSLNAHGFGLAWFEQHRDKDREISFIRHMISDDYSANNTGSVTFSQPHGNTFADVDNDGIKDFIVGKRYWSHGDNYFDLDPYGAPVLYWYKTVRDTSALGGAKFVPKLIHNRSGVGSELTAVDLNRDRTVDIISSTKMGTFIFWNMNTEKER